MAAAFSTRPRKDPRFWRAPVQDWELGKVNSTSDATAQELIREFQALQDIRYNWEPYWADIASRVLPHQNVFQRSVLGVPQAERRTEYIFESTAGPRELRCPIRVDVVSAHPALAYASASRSRPKG